MKTMLREDIFYHMTRYKRSIELLCMKFTKSFSWWIPKMPEIVSINHGGETAKFVVQKVRLLNRLYTVDTLPDKWLVTPPLAVKTAQKHNWQSPLQETEVTIMIYFLFCSLRSHSGWPVVSGQHWSMGVVRQQFMIKRKMATISF